MKEVSDAHKSKMCNSRQEEDVKPKKAKNFYVCFQSIENPRKQNKNSRFLKLDLRILDS